MIISSELRKGNWVMHNGKHRIIEEIGKFGIDLYIDADGEIKANVAFEELEPIDITPELLLDLGFEELPGAKHDVVNKELEGKYGKLEYQGSNYRRTLIKEGLTYVFESSFEHGWTFQDQILIHQPIEFHNLQNLYYYLMGEELQLSQYE
jgi:hypothetical protein